MLPSPSLIPQPPDLWTDLDPEPAMVISFLRRFRHRKRRRRFPPSIIGECLISNGIKTGDPIHLDPNPWRSKLPNLLRPRHPDVDPDLDLYWIDLPRRDSTFDALNGGHACLSNSHTSSLPCLVLRCKSLRIFSVSYCIMRHSSLCFHLTSLMLHYIRIYNHLFNHFISFLRRICHRKRRRRFPPLIIRHGPSKSQAISDEIRSKFPKSEIKHRRTHRSIPIDRSRSSPPLLLTWREAPDHSSSDSSFPSLDEYDGKLKYELGVYGTGKRMYLVGGGVIEDGLVYENLMKIPFQEGIGGPAASNHTTPTTCSTKCWLLSKYCSNSSSSSSFRLPSSCRIGPVSFMDLKRVFDCSSVVDMSCKLGLVSDARKLFEQMPEDKGIQTSEDYRFYAIPAQFQ